MKSLKEVQHYMKNIIIGGLLGLGIIYGLIAHTEEPAGAAANGGITTIYDVNKLTVANGKNANVRLVARDMAVSEWHDETGKLQRRLLFLGPESTVEKEIDISKASGPIFTPDKNKFGLIRRDGKEESIFVYYSIGGGQEGEISFSNNQSVDCFFSTFLVLTDIDLHQLTDTKKITFINLATKEKKIVGDDNLGFRISKALLPNAVIMEGVNKGAPVIQAYTPDGTLIWSYNSPIIPTTF